MAYYTHQKLKHLGFRHVGENVRISDKASIYNHDQIIIDDNSRIDDFCIISGKIKIGKFVHITPMCLLAGGEPGLEISDFCTLAYGVKVFTQSDDYTGKTMTNSNISKKYKNEFKSKVIMGKHTIIGAGSIIMPGVTLAEGTSVGAMSLVHRSTEAWSIYVGSPAQKIKSRSKDLLTLEKKFIEENNL